jgi:hypothetical protein
MKEHAYTVAGIIIGAWLFGKFVAPALEKKA